MNASRAREVRLPRAPALMAIRAATTFSAWLETARCKSGTESGRIDEPGRWPIEDLNNK